MQCIIKSINDGSKRVLLPKPSLQLQLGRSTSLQTLMNFLADEGLPSKDDLLQLIYNCSKLLQDQENIIKLNFPLFVVGDIHGQYYDLLKIMDIIGRSQKDSILFLGDYVDRGCFSVQVLILLYLMKLKRPQQVILLRGNHQCKQVTSSFNFRTQCLYKYDQEIYEAFIESFKLMPLACIVNGKHLALHGGLSPEVTSLSDLLRIQRMIEPPQKGPLQDILWADPNQQMEGFQYNYNRGCSFYYGKKVLNQFLFKNKLSQLIRAHQALSDGYKTYCWNRQRKQPNLITVFSAPNYCDVLKNKGCILYLRENEMNIIQFKQSEHPFILPNFLDLFSWSMPFVAEKINQIFLKMLGNLFLNDQQIGSFDDSIIIKITQLLASSIKEEPFLQLQSEDPDEMTLVARIGPRRFLKSFNDITAKQVQQCNPSYE